VDLDLGNYERFLDIKLTRDNNITTGKIYQVRRIRSQLIWWFDWWVRFTKSSYTLLCLGHSMLLLKRGKEIIWERLFRYLSSTYLFLWCWFLVSLKKCFGCYDF